MTVTVVFEEHRSRPSSNSLFLCTLKTSSVRNLNRSEMFCVTKRSSCPILNAGVTFLAVTGKADLTETVDGQQRLDVRFLRLNPLQQHCIVCPSTSAPS